MSRQKSKEEIRNHKNKAIDSFSSFLDTLIESPGEAKRADLISYWIKDFQSYISMEKIFDPSQIKSYRRGEVIKVNLGFNIGSEQGGLRYAVVLDKNNSHNSKTITVIPLTSRKEEKRLYPRDIDLGHELYNRLKAKFDSAMDELLKERCDRENTLEKSNILLDSLLKLSQNSKDSEDGISEIISQTMEIIDAQGEAIGFLYEKERDLDKIKSELNRMKDGSIAKIEQITTISKQRIFDPKRSSDVLYGIKFSDTAMDKINEKIKELYIF